MMKRLLSVTFAVLLLLMSAIPCRVAMAEKTGTVIGGWLILRDQPSLSGRIVSSYPRGTVVTITGQVGTWYAVTAPDGLQGYMLGSYLQIGENDNPVPDGSTAYVTSTNGMNVRLRSGPGKGYAILAAYPPGTQCTVLTSGIDWSKIRIGKYTGYMMTRFLTVHPVSTPGTNPDTLIPDGTRYYVSSPNGQGVNLRAGPGKAFASIGFYSVGTSAVMVSKGEEWSYIQIGSRYGYMMTRYLTESQPSVEYQTSGSYVVSANGRNVNLRAQPTTASAVIASFRVGTPVTVISRGSDWYFLQINGYYGYMMRQFVYDKGKPDHFSGLNEEAEDDEDGDDADEDEDEDDAEDEENEDAADDNVSDGLFEVISR